MKLCSVLLSLVVCLAFIASDIGAGITKDNDTRSAAAKKKDAAKDAKTDSAKPAVKGAKQKSRKRSADDPSPAPPACGCCGSGSAAAVGASAGSSRGRGGFFRRHRR